jgi:hypothetical protein
MKKTPVEYTTNTAIHAEHCQVKEQEKEKGKEKQKKSRRTKWYGCSLRNIGKERGLLQASSQLGKSIWDLCTRKSVNNRQKQMSLASMFLSIQVVPTSNFSRDFVYFDYVLLYFPNYLRGSSRKCLKVRHSHFI